MGEVANADELGAVTIGKARQLVLDVGGEIEPTHHARDAVAGCGQKTPRLVDAVAGLHDHGSAHSEGVELGGEVVHREVAVDWCHRLRIDPRLGIGRSGPHMDVRVDGDAHPFTAPAVRPDLM